MKRPRFLTSEWWVADHPDEILSPNNVVSLHSRAKRRELERLERMSDAELDLEALKRAKDEVFADAQQAAIEMQQAQQRMNRHLERHAELQRQIEAATALLGARHG